MFYFYYCLQIILLCIYRNLTCFSTVCMLLRRNAMTNLDNMLKSRDITLPIRVHIVKAMGFPSSHVQMWELNHKEAWMSNNWCLQTVALEKMLESPLDCKEIKPVNSKENQPWIVIRGTDSEAKSLILWPSDAKSQLTGKDPDARKDRRQKEKWVAEDEMVR